MNREQISKIHIEGYKSIKDCHLDLKMVNVLIGTNGAGKSNFISVFKLLQTIVERDLQKEVARAGGASTLLYNGMKETEQIQIQFEFGQNGYSLVLMPTDNETLVFEGEYFFYRPEYKVAAYPPIKIGDDVGYKESHWRDGTNTKYDNYVFDILDKEKWRIYHFHDTGRSARAKQNTNTDNNAELLFDAGNLAAFLLRIKSEYRENYEDIVRTIQLVAPYFEDFYLEPTLGETIGLRWRQFGSDDVFNAHQLSDGTLRFICLTTLFKQPAALQPETIIVDEPELGLHPYALTILSEMIHSIGQLKQVIVSTQSVELLNEFEVDEVIVVDRGNKGTQFRRLQEEELSAWLETDYSLGDLWKKNILGGRF